jgi:hypothetical protein
MDMNSKVNLNLNSNPYFEYYLNQVIFATCKGISKILIQLRPSKFIFINITSSENFSEFMRFFSKGLNPFKIQTSFKLELFLKFIIQDPEGLGNQTKKETCSI